MQNNQHSTKAVAIIWLSDMKEKGRKRVVQLRKEYRVGKTSIATLKEAEAKQEVICILLRIVNASNMELEKLEELLQGITAEQKQTRLFRQPKVKNPI